MSSDQRVADVFSLTTSESITDATWYGYFSAPKQGQIPGVVTNFDIRFYNDAGGTPVNSSPFSAQSVTAVSQGTGVITTGDNNTVFSYSATLPTPVSISAGTFWISIVENDPATSIGWEWAQTEPTVDDVGHNSTWHQNSGWTLSSADRPFILSNNPNPIPEPTTIFTNKDSFIRGWRKNLNDGANNHLVVQRIGRKRAVLSFDISGITTYPTKAMLKMTVAKKARYWGQDGRYVDVCRLDEPFTEGNGFVYGKKRADMDRGTGEGVTWRCATDTNISNRKKDCDTNWRGGSMSMAVVPTDSVLHKDNLDVGDEVQWDVTSDVIAALCEGVT